MARRWTSQEEEVKRKELFQLYVVENKTIGEISQILSLSEAAIYERLLRLGIPSLRAKKLRYNNQRSDLIIPKEYSIELAEFIGILLGDGCLTPTQVTVTLGSKDIYVSYVSTLMHNIFGIVPKVSFSPEGYSIVYFGSTVAVHWLLEMGLVFNKVKNQVDVPKWILNKPDFVRATLRGLFDTDGSVYKLRWGLQISFCNRSMPLITSVRKMLLALEFHPSRVSGYNLYLTRREDTDRFFKEIGFSNKKHVNRFLKFREEQYGRVA